MSEEDAGIFIDSTITYDMQTASTILTKYVTKVNA